MTKFKELKLLLFSCVICVCSHAQNINWLLGKWDGTGTNANNTEFIRTIVIDSVSGENFSGTRTNELKGRNRAKIVTAFSGYMDKELLYIKNGTVLYKKEPPNGEWTDCSACLPEAKIAIQQEKIIITSRITGCQNECNSVSFFYKPLCDFDTITQRYLVNRFGSSTDINAFEPCIKKTPEQIAAENKRKGQIDDSIKNAIIIAQQKEQQRIKDSITNAKAAAAKRQNEIDDSLAVVKQRQQQIDDSLKVAGAIAKKRQQEVQDSITNANKIAVQKEQQRINESIAAAAAIAKRRQKEIDDSLAVVKQRQQQIDDSLKVAAATAKKRQQQIQDSITNANKIAAQKEQQRINDSVAAAAVIAKKRQKEMDDSIAVAKKRQQQIDDSLKIAAAITPASKDSAKVSTTQAFETRDNVLLETYHIKTPDILIELFDNAQIDGDRVSVYHNNALIVSNKMLVKEPITINIHADTASRKHEFIMIAENLGRIAPNTALMRVTAGSQVYKLSVKTDMKTNAKIVFYYEGN